MSRLLPCLALLAIAAPAAAQDAGIGANGIADAGDPAQDQDAGVGGNGIADADAHAHAEIGATALPAVAPEGRSAGAMLGAPTVPLGGAVRYTLTVRHPAGDRVQLPPRGTNPFAPFHARDLPRESSSTDGALVATTYVVELVALDPEARAVPAVPVSLLSADGKAYDLAAPAVAIEVTDPTVNEPLADLEPRGAKGADGRTNPVRPYVVEIRNWTLAWVLGITGAVLLAALAGALITRWVLRRRRAAAEAALPPPPPYPIARRRLAELRTPGAYERLGAKPYHVELTDTVKDCKRSRACRWAGSPRWRWGCSCPPATS
jgi:hypothetical protein